MSWSSKSLLKDGSWIRKVNDEDEDVDRDPNFGRSVLSKTTETVEGPDGETTITTTTSRSSSVQSLTKRFGGSQDDLKSSTLPSSKSSSSYTRRSPVVKTPTKTETFTERVKSSSKSPIYSSYSPTRTTKVTETVSGKNAEDKLFDTLLPSSIRGDLSPTDSKTTVTTETVTVKSSGTTDAEDHLFNTLSPSTVKDVYTPADSKISSTETVTVRSSLNGDSTKTTTTTRTSSTAEDGLYDHLLPRSITSGSGLSSPLSSSNSSITKREIITVESSRGGESPILSSPTSSRRTSSYSTYTEDLPTTRTTSYTISTTPSDDYSSERKSYSYSSRPDSSYEYSSITSPSVYSSKYRSSSRSDDVTDSVYSTSVKNVYTSGERTVLEKDLCTYCRKPFTGDAKMVLDDMKINCHASCFKCEVCNSTLGHMKAGDSMWIYKRMVHCENCFEVTRDKWRR